MPRCMSRTFKQIVIDAGSDAEVAVLVGARQHQPRDWRLRNSIPAEFWRAFSDKGLATLDELAGAAEHRACERGAA